jgi:hypothetical protein
LALVLADGVYGHQQVEDNLQNLLLLTAQLGQVVHLAVSFQKHYDRVLFLVRDEQQFVELLVKLLDEVELLH